MAHNGLGKQNTGYLLYFANEKKFHIVANKYKQTWSYFGHFALVQYVVKIISTNRTQLPLLLQYI